MKEMVALTPIENFKIYKNNNFWKGAEAICWQFHLDKLEETRSIIEKLGSLHAFQKIESEKSREESLKDAQYLIDIGNYDYYHDEENGVLFDKLPKKDREKLYSYCRGSGKWSKWTAEKILEHNGWQKDEVYWFTISKDNTYNYQLILKDGDWICYCPKISLEDKNFFFNVGTESFPPYKDDWDIIQ